MIDLQETLDYYSAKLKEHGGGAQGMDWNGRESQYLRFSIILKYIRPEGRPSILDVGCGDGEFYEFCRNQGLDIDYKGIDVNPGMVELCTRRFGPGSAITGTLDDIKDEEFDYVIASGTFNAKLTADEKAWRDYFHSSVIRMFSLSRKACIFNMMTTYVDYRYDRLYYAEPNEIGRLAVDKMSRDFILDHSYPLYEMTAAIFKPKEDK